MNAPLVLTSLFNGAWQGALLSLAAAVALRAARRVNAATRYAVWLVVLAACVLLPVANYVFAARPVELASTPATRQVVEYSVRDARVFRATAKSVEIAVKRVSRTDPVTAKPSAASQSALNAHEAGITFSARGATLAADARSAFAKTEAQVLAHSGTILVLLLMLGLVRLALLARDVAAILRARREVKVIEAPFSLRDSVRRPYGFASSQKFATPCVLGFTPPLIVIPERLLAESERTELLSVVLHEHAHVMRFDDWHNLIQRALGAIAYFCPGVHLALRELALCREAICDDAAITSLGDRIAYAQTLSDVARWLQAGGLPAPGFVFRRRQLLRRLEALLDAAVSHAPQPNRRFAAVAVASLAFAAFVVLRFQVPVIAQHVTPPAAPLPPVAGAPDPGDFSIPNLPDAPAAPKTSAHGEYHPVKNAPKAPPAAKAPSSSKAPAAPKTPNAPKTPAAPKAAPAVDGKHGHPAPNAKPIPNPKPAPNPKPVPNAPNAPNPEDPKAPNFPIGPHAPNFPDFVDPRIAKSISKVTMPFAKTVMVIASDDAQRVARRAPRMASDSIRSTMLDQINANVRVMTAKQLALTPQAHLALAGVGHDIVLAPATRKPERDADDLLDALAGAGFKNLSVDQLIQIRDHGVSAQLVHQLQSLGLAPMPIDSLVAFVDHGVSPDFIAAMKHAGYSSLSANDLITLVDNGVNARYVAAVTAAFRHTVSADDLKRMVDNGVSSAFIAGMVNLGYPGLSADEYIRLVDNGITPEFVKRVQRSGSAVTSKHLGVDELIRLRDEGF